MISLGRLSDRNYGCRQRPRYLIFSQFSIGPILLPKCVCLRGSASDPTGGLPAPPAGKRWVSPLQRAPQNCGPQGPETPRSATVYTYVSPIHMSHLYVYVSSIHLCIIYTTKGDACVCVFAKLDQFLPVRSQLDSNQHVHSVRIATFQSANLDRFFLRSIVLCFFTKTK